MRKAGGENEFDIGIKLKKQRTLGELSESS